MTKPQDDEKAVAAWLDQAARGIIGRRVPQEYPLMGVIFGQFNKAICDRYNVSLVFEGDRTTFGELLQSLQDALAKKLVAG